MKFQSKTRIAYKSMKSVVLLCLFMCWPAVLFPRRIRSCEIHLLDCIRCSSCIHALGCHTQSQSVHATSSLHSITFVNPLTLAFSFFESWCYVVVRSCAAYTRVAHTSMESVVLLCLLILLACCSISPSHMWCVCVQLTRANHPTRW